MDKYHKIEPCPFCGDEQPMLLYSAVRCRICGAVGPYHSSGDQAIKMWNTRLAQIPHAQHNSDHDKVEYPVPSQ